MGTIEQSLSVFEVWVFETVVVVFTPFFSYSYLLNEIVSFFRQFIRKFGSSAMRSFFYI